MEVKKKKKKTTVKGHCATPLGVGTRPSPPQAAAAWWRWAYTQKDTLDVSFNAPFS